jgi:hypothetical protein
LGRVLRWQAADSDWSVRFPHPNWNGISDGLSCGLWSIEKLDLWFRKNRPDQHSSYDRKRKAEKCKEYRCIIYRSGTVSLIQVSQGVRGHIFMRNTHEYSLNDESWIHIRIRTGTKSGSGSAHNKCGTQRLVIF